MEQAEHVYVVGMGSEEDWESGRGSLYVIEDRVGERALPVFTSLERLEDFARASVEDPQAHTSMLESAGLESAEPLAEGGFIAMPLGVRALAKAAALVEVDYLIRDPRPGHDQETLRLTK